MIIRLFLKLGLLWIFVFIRVRVKFYQNQALFINLGSNPNCTLVLLFNKIEPTKIGHNYFLNIGFGMIFRLYGNHVILFIKP